MAHDVATTLRSELAALQYKRDRLLAEVRLRARVRISSSDEARKAM